MRDSIIAINAIIQINHYLASNRPEEKDRVMRPRRKEQESLTRLMTELASAIKMPPSFRNMGITPFQRSLT